MNDFGPYALAGSTENYDRYRRRRSWSMNSPQGLQGYAEFLGAPDSFPADLAGGEVAAFSSMGDSGILRPVLIGVATSTLAFLVNRWLGRVFK